MSDRAGADFDLSDSTHSSGEVDLLLETLWQSHGLDFRGYSLDALKRRLWRWAREEGVSTLSSLQEKIAQDSEAKDRLVLALSVKFTRMFRDPSLYVTFREKVVPLLRTYPFMRIWHAGCSTGEEVYSMAILLREEGVYKRCRIYATDMNEALVDQAKAGIFPLASMKENTANYLKSGSKRAFSEYYTVKHDSVIFDPSLKENVVFARHNLATEACFNEFNVILCRNVLIYFDRMLQERVHKLLYNSLSMFGFLALGDRESMSLTPHQSCYVPLSPLERLYRKVS